MRYLCLVYGTEDSLPVMQNPKLMSQSRGGRPHARLLGLQRRAPNERSLHP